MLVQPLPHLVVPGEVPHKVSADLHGVCEEAQFGLEGGSVFPDPEECFLNNIVREVGFVREKQYISEDDWLVPVKQHPEGLHIRVPYLEKELRICDLVVHYFFSAHKSGKQRMQDSASMPDLQQDDLHPAGWML